MKSRYISSWTGVREVMKKVGESNKKIYIYILKAQRLTQERQLNRIFQNIQNLHPTQTQMIPRCEQLDPHPLRLHRAYCSLNLPHIHKCDNIVSGRQMRALHPRVQTIPRARERALLFVLINIFSSSPLYHPPCSLMCVCVYNKCAYCCVLFSKIWSLLVIMLP